MRARFRIVALAVAGLAGVVLLCTALLGIQSPGTLRTVTNTNDSGPGSLRQALADSHDGDTIGFASNLNGQTITLTSAQLVIQSSVTINGPGSSLLTVRMQASNSRVFYVMPSHTVQINGLTITGGHLNDNGGGILNDQSTLTIANCSISGNIIGGASFANSGGGIYSSGTLTLVNSAVSNNTAYFNGSLNWPLGAGISNAGSMTITNTIVQSNDTTIGAAGIYNVGMMTITGSTISNNQASGGHFGGYGGGIVNGGTMTIQTSVINANFAGGDLESGPGGGIYTFSSLQILHSSIIGNSGGPGGGIYGGGTITDSVISNNRTYGHTTGNGGGLAGDGFIITNCTIDTNGTNGDGGGIAGNNSVITNCTITGNTAIHGGGIAGGGDIAHTTFSSNSGSQGGGALYVTSATTLEDTILTTGSAGGANILVNGGSLTTHGYNLSNDNAGGFLTGPGDQINTNPLLGPLQNNGGPTSTYALLPGSPAIDTGDPNFTPPPDFDQRGPGYPRVSNGRIDIGSFEVQAVCMILYDQTDNAGGGGVISQNFETADNAYDAQGADDFIVPAMQTWTIQQIKTNGIYFDGPGPATSVNVTFYFDAAGFPGASVPGGTYNSIPMSDSAGNFTITLPTGLVLTAGTYWISVQANMNFNPSGEWAWSDRTVTSNSPAVWQNPGGGFGTSCTTYGRRGASCNIDPTAPDQVFQILGCTAATATPTPPPITISGTTSYCSNPNSDPVPNVALTLSGSTSGTTSSDASGNYLFSVPSGGSYTVTPSKAALAPGASGISTLDVVAVQRHFLMIGTPLSGCRLTAADVNGDALINTVDVIAIQRFFLVQSTGTANVGDYQFNPVNRSYPNVVSNQPNQNYNALVLGDVATPYVH